MIYVEEEGPFIYAGLENGDGCYCGNSEDKFIPTDPEECNAPCTGNSTEFCGGSWRLQVYDLRLLGDQNDESRGLDEIDDMHHEYTEAPTTEAPIEEDAADALGELGNLADLGY